jgi:hypothetical protein
VIARVRLTGINSRILTVRGARVILDRDLAELYGVTTGALNQAVARNRLRFPADFSFSLTQREITNLISQSVISSLHGGRRLPPRAFTEQGIAMLSSVLRSRRAVAANVAIMRAFVRLRETAIAHAELTQKITDLERKYDGKFTTVFDALRRLIVKPLEVEAPRRRIGFVVDRLPGSQTKAST